MDSYEQIEGLADCLDVGSERKRRAKVDCQPSGQSDRKDAGVNGRDAKSKGRAGQEEDNWASLFQICEFQGVQGVEGKVNEVAGQIFDSERPEASM